MLPQDQIFKNYLKNRQSAIDANNTDKESKTSNLFNEKTFYRTFTKDMLKAQKEVIIYSPFVTKFRSDFFKQTLENLKNRNIIVFIFTRPLEEHDYLMRSEISCALKDLEESGVCICYLPGNIHEKIAIIDREILWEGSLNILSQRVSKEIMRRTLDKDLAIQIMFYLELNKKLTEAYKLKYEKLYRGLITNSKNKFKQKIRIFLLGLAIPITARWLFIGFKVIILLLRSIANLLSFIYR